MRNIFSPISKVASPRFLRRAVMAAMACCLFSQNTPAAVLDNGVDPANLGKGEWIYMLSQATNKLNGYVPSVTDAPSMMSYLKNTLHIQWVAVKAGHGATNYPSAASPQFTKSLVDAAHAQDIKIFGYTRSYGSDLPGELAIAANVINCGADGFIFDAEQEWESGNSWITNGPLQAWQLCGQFKTNWPTKFLGHSPQAIINGHPSFPYKEFGYWCDTVMPQPYWADFADSGYGSPAAAMQWMDSNFSSFYNSLAGMGKTSLGTPWTQAIKPLAPIGQANIPGATNQTAADMINFVNYAKNDSAVIAGGYDSCCFYALGEPAGSGYAQDTIMMAGISAITIGEPTIGAQPSSATQTAASSQVFSISASGSGAIGYRWCKNGIPLADGIQISGSATAALTINPVQASDAGGYTVIVSNFCGSAISSVAVLSVIDLDGPPLILAQPRSQTVLAGTSPTLTVGATGTAPLSYQWYFGGVSLAGATGSSLTLTNVQPSQAGSYSVTVNNQYGTASSAAAALALNYSFNLSVTGSGSISVNPNQSGYAPNSVVMLTATPIANCVFQNWSGDASGAVNPLTVTMSKNKSISAIFSTVSSIAETNIVESRTNGLNRSAYSDVSFADSSLKSTAPGCTAGIGSRYGFSSSCKVVLQPNLLNPGGTYLLETTHGSASSVSTSLVANAAIQNGVFVNSNGTTQASIWTTAFQTASPNAWKTVGVITLNPGATQPIVTFTTTNTDLNSTANRFVSDAYRLTFQQALTVTLSSSANPSPYGAPVTFTATVRAYRGTPTGTVTFFDGNVNLGTAALNGSGVATFALSTLDSVHSPHSITASYSGDTNFAAMASAPLSQRIGAANATLTLTSSPNPSSAGQFVTFIAAVSGVGGVPTGAVTFYDGSTSLGNVSLDGAGTASLMVNSLTVSGSPHSITFAYSGDASFSGSTSSALMQTVTKMASSVVLSSSANPSTYGQSITLTAMVSGNGIPTGTVSFYDEYTWLGSAALNNSGVASMSLSKLSAAGSPHSLTASYSGDVSFGASVSSAVLQTVTGNGAVQSITLSNIWNIQAGSRTYVTTNSTERGFAIHSLSNHVLVVSRTTSPGSIYVLDAETGAEVQTNGVPVRLNNAGITGGFLDLNKAGVAADGAVYAANLTTSSGTVPFKIYRWVNYSDAPYVAYAGAPDGGTTARWGDSMAVRGAGSNTQIIVSGSGSTNLVIFTTVNGVDFAATKIVPASADIAYDLSRGLCFGEGNTFYAKNRSMTIGKKFSFDLVSRTYSLITSVSPLDYSMMGMGLDVADNLMAGVIDDATANSANHRLAIYDISNLASPVVLSNFYFLPQSSGACIANINWGAQADFGAGKFVGLDTQNGLVAVRVASTIVSAPAITAQPQTQTSVVGSTISFAVTATGVTPLTYQWLQNGLLINDGAKFSGSAFATLTISNVQGADAAGYSVVIANAYGTVTSVVAALHVSPAIVSSPASQSAIAGASAVFTVAADGEPVLTYQWLKNGQALSDNELISGATTAALTLSGVSQADAADYSVLVSNPVGSIASSAATLTVIDPPSIASQPGNLVVNAGSIAVFAVSANGTAPLSYQWLKAGIALSDSGNVSGSTTDTLTISGATQEQAGAYSVLISNAAGAVTSAVATLIVIDPPAIIAQPMSAAANAGSTATFKVNAVGASLSYQWQKDGVALADGGAFSGSGTPALTIANVTQQEAGAYSVVIANPAGSVTSATATLTVIDPPNITQQPVAATANAGEVAVFTVAATGTSLSYQWQKGTNALTDSDTITGATTATLTLTNVTQAEAGAYSVIVSNAAGNVTSTEVSLTVIDPPAIGTQPASLAANAGNTAVFVVSVTGTAPLSYQWQKGAVALTDGVKISGATTATLTLANVSQEEAGAYSLVVANAAGTTTSAAATLTVIDPPAITLQPADVTTNAGSIAVFTVNATGTALNYQWQKGTNVLADSDKFTGATTATLTITNVTQQDADAYSVLVSNPAGTVTSAAVTLTVIDPPAFTTQPVSLTGYTGGTVVFTVAVTGTSPGYQWQKGSVILTDNDNVTGSATASLTIAGITQQDAGAYSVTVANPAGSASSAAATLTVIDSIAITAQPVDVTTNAGSNAVFSVTATGANLWYQWSRGATNLVDGGDIVGANSSALTLLAVTSADAGNDYSVTIYSDTDVVTSSTASLTVLSAPWIITQPTNTYVLYNAAADLQVVAGGTPPLSYQWKKGSRTLADGATYQGTGSNDLTITSVTTSEAGNYSVVVSNSYGSVTSSVVSLKIVPSVTVSSPGSGSFNSAFLTVKGKASDPIETLTGVYYQINGGPFLPAVGTTNWTVAITLQPGTNIFAVKSVDADGNESPLVKRKYFLNVSMPLTLNVQGQGSVSGAADEQMLLVGKNYTLTATPAAGQILSNWTGTICSSNNPLVFMMQTGTVIQANFVPNPFIARAGIYNGLFYEADRVNHDRSGFFTLALASAGTYSGKLNLGGVNRSFSGKFAAGGESQVVLTSFPQVTVDLALDVAGDSGVIKGQVTGDGWVAPLLGDRAAFVGAQPTNYTIAFLGDSDGTASPGGDGFANLTLNTDGSACLTGYLPDGTRISLPTAYASRNGILPLYIPLYANKGSLLGWLTNGADNVYQGNLSWIKTVAYGANYLAGFTNELQGVSSTLSDLDNSTRPLALTNAVVVLSGGSLLAPLTNHVTLTDSSKISVVSGQTNGLTLTLTPGTGRLSGSFTDPATGLKTTLKGILMQQQDQARGYFLAPQTGYFLLQGE